MNETTGVAKEYTEYVVTVFRGVRAGLVKVYPYAKRSAARRFADKLDNEYGAICWGKS